MGVHLEDLKKRYSDGGSRVPLTNYLNVSLMHLLLMDKRGLVQSVNLHVVLGSILRRN